MAVREALKSSGTWLLAHTAAVMAGVAGGCGTESCLPSPFSGDEACTRQAGMETDI